MFTGIIEEVGTILEVSPLGDGRRFEIEAGATLAGLVLGESVALSGACHTVVEILPGSFVVQSVATTLGRTTLGAWRVGQRVNLERALRMGDRLGGHMVQGHVDGVGEVTEIRPKGELTLIDFTLPPLVEDVTILHGSIAVDGVSLTVNALPASGMAQVSIIPHTMQVTAIADLRVGSRVNLEGDMVGKYIRQLVSRAAGNPNSEGHVH